MQGTAIHRYLVAVACAAVVVLPTLHACRRQPAASAITVALDKGGPIDWPLELASLPAAREACKSDFCMAGDALDLVLNRAAVWMADYDKELRFDAAIGLSQTREIVDSPELERAWAKAVAVADGDHDHPHRRFWARDLRSPAEFTSQWQAPADGERVNPNRVISEALHCAENGWRGQTTTYVCGAMRDGGGYQTAHALWALVIARQAGCLDESIEPCIGSLREELARAQPETFEPGTTLDIDLYAERLLMLVLAGYEEPRLRVWAKTLIGLQHGDGSWLVPAEEEPYYRYHATNAATWALAEWLRFLTGRPGRAALAGAIRVQAPLPIGGPAFWGCALPAEITQK